MDVPKTVRNIPIHVLNVSDSLKTSTDNNNIITGDVFVIADTTELGWSFNKYKYSIPDTLPITRDINTNQPTIDHDIFFESSMIIFLL